MKKKVLLGMSGGVDSSVAALVLKNQGYYVEGVTLKLRREKFCTIKEDGCGNSRDIEDAKNVAKKINIPHQVIDFTDIFENKVIDYFVKEYINGKTPNPCISCNRNIKFGAMLDTALKMGMDYIATGHYANVKYDDDRKRWLLYKSNSLKDQSYVLYHLTQHQLSHTLFPLQDMAKDDTRTIAAKNELEVAHKSDSQEICFVDDNDYVGFIERYTSSEFPTGDFVDLQGNIIGKHKGIIHYTIGQRKGLGMSFGQHMFVCRINPKNNTVVLGPDGSQLSKGLTADDINYIAVENITQPTQIHVKTRYQAKPAAALLTPKDDGSALIEFEQMQRAVTPGQSAVFYDGDIVLGGGIIRESFA